jgi:hypothetical protein
MHKVQRHAYRDWSVARPKFSDTTPMIVTTPPAVASPKRV